MNIDDEIKKLELQKDHLLTVIKETKVRVNDISAKVRRLDRIKKDVIDTVGPGYTAIQKDEDKEFKDPAQLEIEEPAEVLVLEQDDTSFKVNPIAKTVGNVLINGTIDTESY